MTRMPCCCEDEYHCFACEDVNDTPQQIELTLNIVNQDCSDCADYNGPWVCDLLEPQPTHEECGWVHQDLDFDRCDYSGVWVQLALFAEIDPDEIYAAVTIFFSGASFAPSITWDKLITGVLSGYECTPDLDGLTLSNVSSDGSIECSSGGPATVALI